MRGTRNLCKVSLEISVGKRHSGDLGIDRRIILKSVINGISEFGLDSSGTE
jgi:hypothetical protein